MNVLAGALCGRFAIYPKTLEIELHNTETGTISSISLGSLHTLAKDQIRASNPKIYSVLACFPKPDETITVVSKGGLISEWKCQDGSLLHSVQVPGTLNNDAHVFQIASVANRVFITTVAKKMRLYRYCDRELTEITPAHHFNRIEAGASCLILKVEGTSKQVGELD